MAEVKGLTDEEANACCAEPDTATKVTTVDYFNIVYFFI